MLSTKEPSTPPESTQRTQALLTHMIGELVDKQDAVVIEAVAGQRSVIFEVKVDGQDLRKVIGKKGRTATALRTILLNLSSKHRAHYVLNLLESASDLKKQGVAVQVEKASKHTNVDFRARHDD